MRVALQTHVQPPPSGKPLDGRIHKILLVADSNFTRRRLHRILHHRGFVVHTATTTAQADSILEHFHPDLVVSETRLRASSHPSAPASFSIGPAFLRQVKAQAPHVSTILIDSTMPGSDANLNGSPGIDIIVPTQDPIAQVGAAILLLNVRRTFPLPAIEPPVR